MKEIKECPICGAPAMINTYNTYISSFVRTDKYYVCCSKTFTHRDIEKVGFLSKKEAVDAWKAWAHSVERITKEVVEP